MESIIHDRQDEYYAAINRSNYEGESTVFIEFMLQDFLAMRRKNAPFVPSSGSTSRSSADRLWKKNKGMER